MDFHMKLPRNGKEFGLFLAIVSILSVNIIAPLITCFEIGFHMSVWGETLKVMPFIWICVVILVILTHKPAEIMAGKLIKKEDSFGAHMLTNTICNVLLMSIFLTVIGTWIGSRHFSFEPITHFFFKWPRNFALAFFVEFVIAQPIARFVLLKMHHKMDKGNNK